MFSGRERFGRDFTGLDFDARSSIARSSTNIRPFPLYCASTRSNNSRSLGRSAGSSTRLHEYLLSRAPSRIPDMQTAARDLGISVRSLRRRLSRGRDHPTARSYNRRWSARPSSCSAIPRRSVQETAHALGFADAAAFHRAFKRWTGLTPLEFREGKKGDC